MRTSVLQVFLFLVSQHVSEVVANRGHCSIECLDVKQTSKKLNGRKHILHGSMHAETENASGTCIPLHSSSQGVSFFHYHSEYSNFFQQLILQSHDLLGNW